MKDNKGIRHIKVKRLIDSPLDNYEPANMTDIDLEIISSLVSLDKKKSKKSKDKDESKKKKDKDKKKKDKKKDKKKKKDKEKIKKPKMHIDALDIYGEDEENRREELDKLYQSRFSSSLLLLTDILKETNDTILENKKFLNELKKGFIGDIRVKLSPMAISTQSNSISQLINTKLATVKQITDVNKAISDLELKKLSNDQKVKAADKSIEVQDSRILLDKVFDDLINFDMPEDPNVDKKKEKKKKKKKDKEYDSIDDRIDDLIKDGEIEFTDTENALKYEKDGGVEIAIRMNRNDESDWEFVALNPDGEEVFDYPLPRKSIVGTMKFDDEYITAKDMLGEKYNVYIR